MPEMILPGVYIEVRPEGLIVPGQVSVGNVGVVGTASRGPVGTPTLLGSYAQARQLFGDPDPWKPDKAGEELTLVRALQLVFAHGAGTVFAVRVAADAAAARVELRSAGGIVARLTARSEGTWGNEIGVNVDKADVPAVVSRSFRGSDLPVTLAPPPMESARTRVTVTDDATGITRALAVVYDPAAVAPGQARLDRGTGSLTFGDVLAAADVVEVTYVTDKHNAVKVTLRRGTQQEVYTVVDGADLVADVNDPLNGSAWATASTETGDLTNAAPGRTEPEGAFVPLRGGDNGVKDADYQTLGLNALLTVDAHIVVGAGQDDSKTFGAALAAHCDQASTDAYRRDRIGVLGSRPGVTVDQLVGHAVDSDRVIFVAPGIIARDPASGEDVPLPGSYAAAAVAGKLSSLSPHVSLTNRPMALAGLTQEFGPAELAQLVKARVLVLERRQGFRVVKGITTSTGSAFAQVTTRRIVDYAKYGTRSAAQPYIGLLNNERVRGAMHATINTFLDGMVRDEMLTGYDLAVTATREEERQGIARVTMTLRPTFSIDYVRVTMFLE
jgi:hypothetical protein